MTEELKKKATERVQNRRVHMANERTFLAWIRTSIGIMAFGFVVEKFALFVRQMDRFLTHTTGKNLTPLALSSGPGISSIVGVMLIGLGAVMGLLAFIRYKNVEKQIDRDTYHPSIILDAMLALSILAVAFFLIIYLSHTF
jgi:uncharacterized membrane protein YidH (DUF202 family)